jgi:hypothetical protein
MAAMGIALSESSPLIQFAVGIQRRLAIEAVVVHTRDCAACAEANGTSCEIAVPSASTHASPLAPATTSMRVIFSDGTPAYCLRKRYVWAP